MPRSFEGEIDIFAGKIKMREVVRVGAGGPGRGGEPWRRQDRSLGSLKLRKAGALGAGRGGIGGGRGMYGGSGMNFR